jgi:hypothetical protein
LPLPFGYAPRRFDLRNSAPAPVLPFAGELSDFAGLSGGSSPFGFRSVGKILITPYVIPAATLTMPTM